METSKILIQIFGILHPVLEAQDLKIEQKDQEIQRLKKQVSTLQNELKNNSKESPGHAKTAASISNLKGNKKIKPYKLRPRGIHRINYKRKLQELLHGEDIEDEDSDIHHKMFKK